MLVPLLIGVFFLYEVLPLIVESCFYTPPSSWLQALTFPKRSCDGHQPVTHGLPHQLPTEPFWPFLSMATPCLGMTKRAAARGKQDMLHGCGEGSLSGSLALLGLTAPWPVELTCLQEPTMITQGLYQWLDTLPETTDLVYHGRGVGISDSSTLQATETRQPTETCFFHCTGSETYRNYFGSLKISASGSESQLPDRHFHHPVFIILLLNTRK